jgi:hypothetical protein
MRVTHRAAILVLVPVLGLVPASRSPATVMLALSLEELSVQANRVVVGQVRSLEARWSGDGKIIETVIEIDVQQEITDASASPVVRVVQPGGRIGDRGYLVTGMPEFRAGERVLLFLRAAGVDADGTPYFSVVGMTQGKFVILPRIGGGWDAVQQFPGGFALAAPDANGSIRTVDGARPLVIDLDEAVARIRAARGEVAP